MLKTRTSLPVFSFKPLNTFCCLVFRYPEVVRCLLRRSSAFRLFQGHVFMNQTLAKKKFLAGDADMSSMLELFFLPHFDVSVMHSVFLSRINIKKTINKINNKVGL